MKTKNYIKKIKSPSKTNTVMKATHSILDVKAVDRSKLSNGGDYDYWRDFIPTKDGKYEVRYGTSSEFQYCSTCGNFGHHEDNCQEDVEIIEQLPEDAAPYFNSEW